MKNYTDISARPVVLALCTLALLLVAACTESQDDPLPDSGADGAVLVDSGADRALPDSGSPDARAAADVTPAADSGPTLPSGLKAGWNILYPGGKSICSRGTKFGFGVHPGTVNKVIIDFEGGGACWTYPSCAVGPGLLFKDNVEDSFDKARKGYSEGIYGKTNPKNPLKDWYHVFVPYCTGDIHWGDKVTTYKDSKSGKSITIQHKGAVNAGIVLDWVYKNFSAPEKIFVTGCSAGSYGSIMWATKIAQHYPKATIYQVGDSGAGVITTSFLKDSFPQWNALPSAPSWIPAFDPKKVNLLTKDLTYIYIAIANYYSKQTFAQVNYREDSTQVAYYQAMGGASTADWSQKMRKSIDTIVKGAPTFRHFMSAGTKHCALPYDRFYTAEVNGRKLVDWVSDLVNDKPVKNVLCSTCGP